MSRFTFLELVSLYRAMGWSRLAALRLAWKYRRFTPDHSESMRYKARIRLEQDEAKRMIEQWDREHE